MPTRSTIRPETLNDIIALRDIDPDILQSVIRKLSEADPAPLRPDDIYKIITDVIGEQENISNALMSLIMWFYSLRTQRAIEVSAILSDVDHRIQSASKEWNEIEKERWGRIRSQLDNLLSISAIINVCKASDLSYDYQNILQNIKIITDVRPIFDEEASRFNGSIISYILQVYYSSVNETRSLSLALDHADVKQLLNQCERALKKAETAKKFMTDHNVASTFISGEDL